MDDIESKDLILETGNIIFKKIIID